MATERRLIDAYERMEWLNDNTAESDWIVSQYSADWIYSMLESTPKVDAVEVVRCKDCKGYEWNEFDGCYVCIKLGKYGFRADDFCSYGERRTDNG